MGVYVDAEDLRQHFRQGGSLTDELIEEIMLEKETYVMQRLGLSELPPDNPILKDIVRDLTIAGAIYFITPAQADNVIKADSQRREALRKLEELRAEGFKGVSTPKTEAQITAEVYNPYPEPFFLPSDFRI